MLMVVILLASVGSIAYSTTLAVSNSGETGDRERQNPVARILKVIMIITMMPVLLVLVAHKTDRFLLESLE